MKEHPECRKYFDVWSELSTEKDCIMRGARVVIPQSLRPKVLEELHAGHQGIVRTKQIARNYVWWPGIDLDIESHVKSCPGCAFQSNNPTSVKYHPWIASTKEWQRLHIDFAGPFLGHSYLIVVDSFSKWPEVIPMASTTSGSTINALSKIFATHGLPERIHMDNGPQFSSVEFSKFCRANGIVHSFSAPYHPSTNGEAERFVQTFKRAMKCSESNSRDVSFNISKFLLNYRNTPHSVTGVAPSVLLMGRRLRSRLDLLRPDLLGDQNNKQLTQAEKMNKVREFQRGDTVLCRSYINPNKWSTGQVQEKLGYLHYKVKVGGNIVHRHIDQLKTMIKTEPEPQIEHEIIDLTSDDICPSFSGDESDPHSNVNDKCVEESKTSNGKQ